MILPEVLVSQKNVWVEPRNIRVEESVRMTNEQTRMTINALSTMAITFVIAAAALLVLAGSSLSEAFVAGAVAIGAAFINLVRRPPDDASVKKRISAARRSLS